MKFLELPQRFEKPRAEGLTILIDNGYPTSYFEDVVNSHSNYIDYIKFGWGTGYITKDIEEKISFLKQNNIGFFFGGTFFEKALSQNKVDDFVKYLQSFGCDTMEISNGTLDISNTEKAMFISDLSSEFQVFSEVGYKDNQRSQEMFPAKWVEYIQEDFSAGASRVITEARESGASGICRSNGELRFGLIEEILNAGLDNDKLIFEAPNKSLQVYFVKHIGSNVSLANIPFSDVIALETLRLGLRSDTFECSGGDFNER